MKVKVMIIDDEYIILDGLSSIPWNDYGCELVATAQNGEEGLNKLQEKDPDLVFTDIKMPQMDGLEFAQKARKYKPDLRIVFLTGYENFDYAQQAIRVSASEYLLKPMDFEKLDNLIKRITAEILSEKETKRYYKNLEESFTKELPYIKAKFVDDLIHGRIRDRQDMEVQASALEVKIEKYVCVIITRKQLNMNKTSWQEQYAFLNVGEEVLNDYSDFVLSEYDDMDLQFIFIMCFSRTTENGICIQKCIEACEKLSDVSSRLLKIDVFIGMSSTGTDSYNIWKKYREACQANGQNNYLGDYTIIKYDDLESNKEIDISITEGKRQQLFREIYNGQISDVRTDLDELLVDDLDIQDAKFLALDLLISCMQYPSLCKINCKIKNEKYDFSFLQDGIRVINGTSTVEDIKKYLLKVFGLLAKQANASADDRYKIIVDEIIKFINEHYSEDISINDIADEFHMSRTYVSRLIKLYSDHTFLTVLLNIRMEAARKMIIEDKFKMYEIAEKVGYNDFSYFIQVFKKYYGVTPNEYRKTT